MNNITWAVQTNLMNDINLHKIWYAAQEAGANVQELVVIPFTYDFDIIITNAINMIEILNTGK